MTIHVRFAMSFPEGHPEWKEESLSRRVLDAFQGFPKNEPHSPSAQWLRHEQVEEFTRTMHAIGDAMRKADVLEGTDYLLYVLALKGSDCSNNWFMGLRDLWPRNATLVLAPSRTLSIPAIAVREGVVYSLPGHETTLEHAPQWMRCAFRHLEEIANR